MIKLERLATWENAISDAYGNWYDINEATDDIKNGIKNINDIIMKTNIYLPNLFDNEHDSGIQNFVYKYLDKDEILDYDYIVKDFIKSISSGNGQNIDFDPRYYLYDILAALDMSDDEINKLMPCDKIGLYGGIYKL